MKTAAVVIDRWKLPIFKRYLDNCKCTYTESPGITKDTLLLKVEYDFVANLKPIIEAANAECAREKGQNAK